MGREQAIDVALVATSPDGDESLALGYLAASLRKASHRPHVFSLRDAWDLDPVATQVMETRAPLLGISIPSGLAAIDMLAFALRVREVGFCGHLTCGGTYATLCRERLLNERAEIDSVVRHDGEIPIVMLADAIAAGRPLPPLSGITTRTGDGLPAPMRGSDPDALWVERAAPRLYAGVPAAKMSAVRGCWGRCRYCGLAALHAHACDEAERCGMSKDEVRRAGIGSMRRRSIDSVADEMAGLYHTRGVRYFHFVDENHLPRDEGEACRVLGALDMALDRRGVGRRALSMMLRADSATDAVVGHMQRLGIVRSLLGVESMCSENLRCLGRSMHSEVSLRAMENLSRAGVTFHFNLLLIHPDSTIESIDRELAALDTVHGGLLDPFQVEVLEGTELFRKLERDGRLEGGPLLWHFWPLEPEARRFTELFGLLKRRAIGHIALTPYAYEVLGSFAIARQLGRIHTSNHFLAQEAANLVRRHNDLWLRLLRRASALSRVPPSRDEWDGFLMAAQIDAARLTLDFKQLEVVVARCCEGSLHSDVAYPRIGQAAAVALAVIAASCQTTAPATQPMATEALPQGIGAVDAQQVAPSWSSPAGSTSAPPGGLQPGPAVSQVGPAGSQAGPAGSQVGPAGSQVGPAGSQAGPAGSAQSLGANGTPPRLPVCGRELMREQADRVRELSRSLPCNEPCIHPNSARKGQSYHFVLNDRGRVVDIRWDEGLHMDANTKRCYLQALRGQVFPCAGELRWYPCVIALK